MQRSGRHAVRRGGQHPEPSDHSGRDVRDEVPDRREVRVLHTVISLFLLGTDSIKLFYFPIILL